MLAPITRPWATTPWAAPSQVHRCYPCSESPKPTQFASSHIVFVSCCRKMTSLFSRIVGSQESAGYHLLPREGCVPREVIQERKVKGLPDSIDPTEPPRNTGTPCHYLALRNGPMYILVAVAVPSRLSESSDQVVGSSRPSAPQAKSSHAHPWLHGQLYLYYCHPRRCAFYFGFGWIESEGWSARGQRG